MNQKRGFIATMSLVILSSSMIVIVFGTYAAVRSVMDSVDTRHARLTAYSKAHSCAGYAERLLIQDPYVVDNYYLGKIYPEYSCSIALKYEAELNPDYYSYIVVGTSTRISYEIKKLIEIKNFELTTISLSENFISQN